MLLLTITWTAFQLRVKAIHASLSSLVYLIEIDGGGNLPYHCLYHDTDTRTIVRVVETLVKLEATNEERTD